MEGRRRVGRKEGDFVQTLGLFRQLIQLVNAQMLNNILESNEPKKKTQVTIIEKKTVIVAVKEQVRQQESEKKEQKLNRIGLRSWRDWEGLCSQRKEDVFGEYAVCFDYAMTQEPCKMAEPIQNGICQSQPLSNN